MDETTRKMDQVYEYCRLGGAERERAKRGKVGNASAIANALREVSVKELGDADLNIWIWRRFFTKLISTEYISKCKLLSGETDTLTH